MMLKWLNNYRTLSFEDKTIFNTKFSIIFNLIMATSKIILSMFMGVFFLIAGIIPLVPGAGVYYTAYYLMTGDLALAIEKGMGAVAVAFAIVLGIVFVLAIPRQFFQKGYWKQWFILSSWKKIKS